MTGGSLPCTEESFLPLTTVLHNFLLTSRVTHTYVTLHHTNKRIITYTNSGPCSLSSCHTHPPLDLIVRIKAIAVRCWPSSRQRVPPHGPLWLLQSPLRPCQNSDPLPRDCLVTLLSLLRLLCCLLCCSWFWGLNLCMLTPHLVTAGQSTWGYALDIFFYYPCTNRILQVYSIYI